MTSKLSKTTTKTADGFGLWVRVEMRQEVHGPRETECLVFGSNKYEEMELFIYRTAGRGRGWVFESSILSKSAPDIKEEMPHWIKDEESILRVINFLASVGAADCLRPRMKPKYQISFSGGRTSGYMTKYLLDNFSDDFDFIVTFANTGLEREETLQFVKNCDEIFGFNTVWLEAVTHHGERRGCSHRVVTFETAARSAEPFKEMISKYGIPNQAYPHCTRELKINAMRSYLKSIGIPHASIPTAVGIRADEARRVSKTASYEGLVYPLIEDHPMTKKDVIGWWGTQPFDLGLEEHDGNCIGCFRKSDSKIRKQLESDPNCLDFHAEMETLYPQVGNRKEYAKDRVFFRLNRSAGDMKIELLNRTSQ